MTLTSKFKKDISTLRAAINEEIFLDVKNPKLYKKLRRYYENEGVEFGGEDPDADYSTVIQCLKEDFGSEVVYSQTANPNATDSEFDGYRYV